MRILHATEFYYPSLGGVQEVVRQLSERLVCYGHEVTVVTSRLAERSSEDHNGVRIVEFPLSGNLVRGFNGDIRPYQEFVINGDYDLVTCFAAQQWTFDALAPVLARIRAAKVFVPTGFSALPSPAYQGYFSAMPDWLNQFDMNVFLSDRYRDIDFARHHNIAQRVLIPNGAAAEEFLRPLPDIRSRLGIPANHFMILQVGSHTGLKGHDKAMEIFRRAVISDVTLLIVGDEAAGGCGGDCRSLAERLNNERSLQKAGKRIMVTSLPRQDTVAAYQAADLFLFPSLVECSPIVLFESMASRTPFLTSDVGNSAEIIDWSGGAGLLLPTEQPSRLRQLAATFLPKGDRDDFGVVRVDINGSAALLAMLYRDKERQYAMASAGFNAWQQRFTWEKIALEYETLYRTLVEAVP